MKAWAYGTALVLGIAATAASAQPIEIVRQSSKNVAINKQHVLFQQGDTLVLKTDAATVEDFRDLYVVNTTNWFALPQGFDAYGEVIAFEPTKFAVMRVAQDRVAGLSHLLHHSGMACGLLTKLSGRPISLRTPVTPTPMIPITMNDERVAAATAVISADNIRSTIEMLSALNTRYHTSTTGTGAAVADMLAERYEMLRMARPDVTISTYDHGSETPQRSLIVRIEGRTRPDEVIVLGSHLDSVNGSSPRSGRAPGADDNASGTATNLEIFRALMEQGIALDRTLEIHAYAAEEIGLVGSDDIARRYSDDGVNVVAMVQHDMNLWKAANTPDKIWLVSNNTNAGFNTMLGTLIDTYVGMARGSAVLTAGSSDHASWTRAGFAAAFPFENPQSYNRSIHTANDTIANSGAFTQAAGFAKLGVAYVLHFAGIN